MPVAVTGKEQNQKRCHPNLRDKAKTYSRRRLLVIALRREETGVLAMELSENFWPEDLELAFLAVHDIARSPQNSLLLLVAVDSDFDTPLWDFLCQILQPGILVQNRPSRVAVLAKNPAEPKTI
jgi:hypothetical protein